MKHLKEIYFEQNTKKKIFWTKLILKTKKQEFNFMLIIY